jgi:hypothetical protein
MQSVSADTSAEDMVYTYLLECDDTQLIESLYAVWGKHNAGEFQTSQAYEQAYVTLWREILSSHDRFKYYPTTTREAVLKRAAAEQRGRDSVSF